MNNQTPTSTRAVLFCRLAVFAVGLAVPVSGRTESPQMVYVVIKAPATESIEEIKDKFELARRNTVGNFNCDGVIVEPIKAETFGLLNSIVTRGAEAARNAAEQEVKKVIERVAGERRAWTIDLGGAAFIESATLDVVAPGKTEEESLEVTVGTPDDKGVELAFHSPGRYIVRAAQGVRPIRFHCKAVDTVAGNGAGEREVQAEFPPLESGLTYLVTLNGVRGEAKFLFEALKDGDKVNNPIQQMGDVPLIVANFVPIEGSFIVDGSLLLRFGVPKGEKPARLWLFLAPTTEARDAEKQRVVAEGFTEIPALIRKNESKSFLPGAGAGWVALSPPANGWFEGRVQVDVPAWKAAITAGRAPPNDSLLMVYEGDYGGELRPIRIESEYVVTEQIPRWLPALKAAK